MFFPVLNLAGGNITLIIMLGVSLPTVSLSLNQDSAMTFTGIVDGLLRYFVTGNHVITVNDVAGNTKAGGAFREIANRGLRTGRRRIGVVVVFRNNDQRKTLDRRKVHS